MNFSSGRNKILRHRKTWILKLEHFQETFISSLNEKLKNEESLFVPDHPTDCFFYKNQLYIPRRECKFVPFQLEDFEIIYDEE